MHQDQDGIHDAVFDAGLAPYLAQSNGNPDEAAHLYLWNVAVSAAFYPLLHFAEVTLRSALNHHLAARSDRPDWWATIPLNDHGVRLVKEAGERATNPVTPEKLVAKLTLGFWVSLISKGYDRPLWVPTLHRAFPHYHGRRDALHAELRELLRLRNKVMHHEPIHQRNLVGDHERIHRLLGHLSPAAAGAARLVDRVPQLLVANDGR